MKDFCQKMEGKTDFSRRLRLKQFDDLTWLTLTPTFYERSTPLFLANHLARTYWQLNQSGYIKLLNNPNYWSQCIILSHMPYVTRYTR